MSKLLIPIASLAVGAFGAMSVNYVTLQAATPGTPDSGNLNVGGTIIGGKVMAGINSSVSMVTGYAANSTATGVQGLGKFYGVRGQSTTTSGASYGGYFDCNSPDGYGAWIRNKATAGPAIGLLLQSASPSGVGVDVGMSSGSGNPTGILSIIFSSGGTAKAFSGDGNAGYGAYFKAKGTNGFGVAVESDGIGFDSVTTNGQAVYGSSVNANYSGVQGFAPDGSSGSAVLASGRLTATGTKTMQIDDPADPTGHYLLQYCAEGDTPQLQYRGVAKLDSAGAATVSLPDYFDSINRDPSYQLTALDVAMPNLHIAQREKNNLFKIGGGKPGGEVSWMVIGIRNDRYVKKYGAPVRMEKPTAFKGTYLQPELYGEPVQKNQDYDPKNGRFQTQAVGTAPPASNR